VERPRRRLLAPDRDAGLSPLGSIANGATGHTGPAGSEAPFLQWTCPPDGDGALAVVAPSVAPQGSAAVGLQLSRTAQRQGQISRPTFRRRGPRQPRQRRIRPWRPCGSIASPSRPAAGRGRGSARGPHRSCPRPGRGGRSAKHGPGAARACPRGGAGREVVERPTPSLPGGWFRESNPWQRVLRRAVRRVGGPAREGAWQS
jgi:hypothetical protein